MKVSPLEFDKIFKQVESNSITREVGSKLHQTDGPNSDSDLISIYYDSRDDRRVFKYYPDVLHDKDSDHKLYSLREFARLLEAGNPNALELVQSLYPKSPRVIAWGKGSGVPQIEVFTNRVRPYVFHTGFFSACLGHSFGVMTGLENNHSTPWSGKQAKIAAHGVRVAYLGLLKHVTETEIQTIRDVKFEVKTKEETLNLMKDLVSQLQVKVNTQNLPSSEGLKEVINDFFTLI